IGVHDETRRLWPLPEYGGSLEVSFVEIRDLARPGQVTFAANLQSISEGAAFTEILNSQLGGAFAVCSRPIRFLETAIGFQIPPDGELRHGLVTPFLQHTNMHRH